MNIDDLKRDVRELIKPRWHVASESITVIPDTVRDTLASADSAVNKKALLSLIDRFEDEQSEEDAWRVIGEHYAVVGSTAQSEFKRLDELSADRDVSPTEILSRFEQYEKQLKPIAIPPFVADWIETCKENKLTAYAAMTHDDGHVIAYPHNVGDWLDEKPENRELFVTAWVNGFTILEPGWCVTYHSGGLYFKRFKPTGSYPFDPEFRFSERYAYRFSNKEDALAVAQLLGEDSDVVEYYG